MQILRIYYTIRFSSDISKTYWKFDVILDIDEKVYSIPYSKKDVQEFYAVNYQQAKNLYVILEKILKGMLVL
ncbi:MAG: hypothetical protein LBQ22_00695 [Bacteroidales bacterium]|nr:hypothetical protein [Bacteroidales bacterium]